LSEGKLLQIYERSNEKHMSASLPNANISCDPILLPTPFTFYTCSRKCFEVLQDKSVLRIQSFNLFTHIINLNYTLPLIYQLSRERVLVQLSCLFKLIWTSLFQKYKFWKTHKIRSKYSIQPCSKNGLFETEFHSVICKLHVSYIYIHQTAATDVF
jgi:hypothetical protein